MINLDVSGLGPERPLKYDSMKKILMLLILVTFSCKSSKEIVAIQKADALVYYSKGPCLGDRCPVYDFWVFSNGDVLYKTPKGPSAQRERHGKLSSKEIANLAILLNNNLGTPPVFKRTRDLPITTIRFDGEKYEYHASKIDAGLKVANSKIEALVERVLKNDKEI